MECNPLTYIHTCNKLSLWELVVYRYINNNNNNSDTSITLWLTTDGGYLMADNSVSVNLSLRLIEEYNNK